MRGGRVLAQNTIVNGPTYATMDVLVLWGSSRLRFTAKRASYRRRKDRVNTFEREKRKHATTALHTLLGRRIPC